MLLIITNKSDLACDYLILRLKERDVSFMRFNTDSFPNSSSGDIWIKNNVLDFRIRIGDQTIASTGITGVYFRQPTLPVYESAKNPVEKEFAEAELTEMLRGLWRVIPEKLWLNHPRKLWIASNKVEQLVAAAQYGFLIPDTLISSSFESIREFFKETGPYIIAKAVRHGFVRTENETKLAGTQRVSKEYTDNLEQYAPIPMTYQEEIQKGVDIRAVVVKDTVFATKLISKCTSPNIDWRIDDINKVEIVHEPTFLPFEVKRSCIDIVKHFGLRYSSIDLVQNKDGEYFFLELNPNGQWAWIEQITQYPIRDALIEALTGNEL